MTANVALTDTFDQWRVKTNELIVGTQSDGMANILKTTDTTNSTSNTTGSIITAGGVGIAKSVHIGEDLKVWGDVTTVGDTTISGNLTFGDASTDQVTFSADINSSLVPNANLTFNIGNTTMQWANVWVGHAGITQKTDSGKTALTVTSTDTDQIAVSIAASQIDADVLDIAADAVTTAKVIDITADSLTTGSGIYLADDSASTSTRNTVDIRQDNAAAIAATALNVQSDGGITGIALDKNFSGVAAATVTGLKLDFDRTVPGSGTATFTDIGIDLDVNAAGLGTTTTTGLDIDVVGATSGTHTAVGLDVVVGSADTNIAAKFSGGEVALLTTAKLSFHDVAGGENIVASADGHLEINSGTTLDITAPTVDINASTLVQVDGPVSVGVDDTGHDVKFFGATASAYMLWDESEDQLAITGHGAVLTQSKTSGIALDVVRNLAASDTDNMLMRILNDHASDDQTCLGIYQHGTGNGIFIDHDGSGGDGIQVHTSGSTGRAAYFYSDQGSSQAGSKPLVEMHADNTGWDQTVLELNNDGTAIGLYIDQNGAGSGLEINGTDGDGRCLYVYTDNNGDVTQPAVDIFCDNTAYDNPALHVRNDGTGTHAWGIRCPDGGVAISTEGTNFARNNTGGIEAITQIQGLSSDSALSITRHADAAAGPYLTFSKSRGTALGAVTAVVDNDECGTILFAAADGTDHNHLVASIQCRINGTPGGNDLPGELVFGTTADGAVTPTNHLYISQAGYIGVSTAAPTTALHVTGVITETSMRETKTNISNMNNMLPSVLQMQGVKFDFKDKKHGQYKDNYGFIAEDVDKILPHLVTYGENGKPSGIQYTKMTAVLLEAIKEQQAQIDELKTKILN